MPERWERELQKLRGVDVREPVVRQRLERGPSGHRPPTRRDRLAAGVVAAIVFLAAGAFAWRALGPGGAEIPFASGSWPIATVSFNTSAAGERLATLDVGGSEQEGLTGASTSPNDRYPYSWLPPDRLDDLSQPLEVPMGSELALDGNVAIKELLYGDAEQLDDGAGPDSGPIWADQPDFSEPYFLPWDEEPERTYLKFFGTWADGEVLDVYFEVVFVAPDVDLTDPGAEIVVTPEPMDAAFLYGGQRSRMGLLGGTYGNTSSIGEPAGYEAGAIVAKVPAGTPLEIAGERLVGASVRAGPLPMGEGGTSLDGTVPTEPGRYVLTLDVTWDGGEATFLHQIEVVPALESPEPTPTIEPLPTPSQSIADSDLVVRVEGLGRSERSRQSPIIRVSFRGETALGCTEGFEWTTADGTKIDEASGREGSTLPLCSYDPLFLVPPRTPIVLVSEEGTEVFATRTTTPLYTGTDGIGVSVRWQDGDADFIAFFEVRYEDAVPRNILLDCPAVDRVTFPAPDGPRIEPGGSAYVRGNLAGFLRQDVIEQMTKRDGGGAGGWDGTWQVTREGSVVATVEFPRLSGVACRGSGIGGA